MSAGSAPAPDVKDYFGYTSLTAAIGQQDGLKLSLTGRGSFETGKGARPELYRLLSPGPDCRRALASISSARPSPAMARRLDDYRRNDTHARIGIALTR